MQQLKVMSLEGAIESYHPDVPTTGFVQINGDINPPKSFVLRTNVFLPVGTPVDVVALGYDHGNGSYVLINVLGIKTKDGQVCYDLTKDYPTVIPHMIREETDLFPEAQRLLYG